MPKRSKTVSAAVRATHKSILGHKIGTSKDPPSIVQQPWYQITVVLNIFNTWTSNPPTSFDVTSTDLFTAYKSQVGLAGVTGLPQFEYRLRQVRIYSPQPLQMTSTQLSNSRLKVLVKDLQSTASVQANYISLEDRAQQTEFLHVGYQYPMSLQADPLFGGNNLLLLQILNHVKSESPGSVSFKVYFTMMIRYTGSELLSGTSINLLDASGNELATVPSQISHNPDSWYCECLRCQESHSAPWSNTEPCEKNP